MVTKIIRNHGVHIGASAETAKNVTEYTSYENQEINAVTKRIWTRHKNGRKGLFGLPVAQRKDFLEDIRKVVESQAKDINNFAYKCSCELSPLFFQFQPKIILVKRERDQAIKAMMARSRNRTYDFTAKVHDRRMSYMEQVQKEHGGVWVNTSELIARNYDSIQEAIEYCGLTYSRDAVEAGINRDIWHKR